MIKIFITGGTIDGIEHSRDKSIKNPKSIIPKLLDQARLSSDYNIEILFSKDSKFITDEDRQLVLNKCRSCKESKIIITHGTMTMTLTAEFLGKQKLKKTIVLVGSNIPAKINDSDAKFNLGFAYSSVKILPGGVYIAMNGNIFKSSNVKKNLKNGVFEMKNAD